MKEDDVLGQIKEHVRAERSDDVALEAVARGETVEALEGRAAEDAEVAALLAASRPLGAAVEERIAARIAPASRPVTRATPKTNVVPFARRLAMVAGPLALAAAVLLYVVAGRDGQSGLALLPDYAVSASGDQTMRGPAPAVSTNALRLHAGDAPFEIVARPATTAGTKVVAYVFAIGEGEPSPVDAKIKISPEGSIRIQGRARALQGARELRVVIGVAEGSIKRFDDALGRASNGKSDASVRVFTVPIVRD